MNSLFTPPIRLLLGRIAAGLLIVLTATTAVRAEENEKKGFFGFFKGEGGKTVAQTPAPPKYKQECASCHMAYPPGLLPAASWQRLMTSLPRHFGAEASLDPATQKSLSAWLAANAGSY